MKTRRRADVFLSPKQKAAVEQILFYFPERKAAIDQMFFASLSKK